VSDTGTDLEDVDMEDCSKLKPDMSIFHNWLEQEQFEEIRDCFVTGEWNKAAKQQKGGVEGDGQNEDDSVYGDFEDLETGERHVAADADNHMEQEAATAGDRTAAEERRLQKLALRAKFDAQYLTYMCLLYFVQRPSILFCYFFQFWYIC
jgi:ribosome biogenesis protein BMS1